LAFKHVFSPIEYFKEPAQPKNLIKELIFYFSKNPLNDKLYSHLWWDIHSRQGLVIYCQCMIKSWLFLANNNPLRKSLRLEYLLTTDKSWILFPDTVEVQWFNFASYVNFLLGYLITPSPPQIFQKNQVFLIFFL
jgi:hypothetical protein